MHEGRDPGTGAIERRGNAWYWREPSNKQNPNPPRHGPFDSKYRAGREGDKWLAEHKEQKSWT